MAKVNQGKGWRTAKNSRGVEIYFDPTQNRWENAKGGKVRAKELTLAGVMASNAASKPAATTTARKTTTTTKPTPTSAPVVRAPSGGRGVGTTGVSPSPAPSPAPVVRGPTGGRGTATTGVSGGSSGTQTQPAPTTPAPTPRPNVGQNYYSSTSATGAKKYYDPNQNRWENAQGGKVRDARLTKGMRDYQTGVRAGTVDPWTGMSHAGLDAQLLGTTTPAAVEPGQAEAELASAMTGIDPLAVEFKISEQNRESLTEDPRQDPRVLAGTHYVGYGNAIIPYSRQFQSAELGGIQTGNVEYDSLTPKQKYDMQRRASELGYEGINRSFTKHHASTAARQLRQAEAQQRYQQAMEGNWSPERQAVVKALRHAGMLTYDEYMRGAHDSVPDGQGGYVSQGNTTVGYRPDGSFGWYDKRDYPGWTHQMGQDTYAPSRSDLNAAHAMGWDVTNMGRNELAQALSMGAPPQIPGGYQYGGSPYGMQYLDQSQPVNYWDVPVQSLYGQSDWGTPFMGGQQQFLGGQGFDPYAGLIPNQYMDQILAQIMAGGAY